MKNKKQNTKTYINNTEFKGNTTVSIVRSSMFSPSLKRAKTADRDIVFQNQWATLKILKKYNRLTQVHANILDCIIAVAAEIVKLSNGEIIVKFEIYKVLKMLGHANKKNYEWLKEKLDDLATTLIEMETKEYGIHENILHFHRWSITPNSNAYSGGFAAEEHFYYAVCFNSSYAKFFDIETNLNYIKILPDILALPSGILQAFVRFCISHDKVNMKTTEILKAIRAFDGISERGRRRAVEEIKENKQLLFEKFKITIKDGITYYNHTDADGVYFFSQAGNQTNKGVMAALRPQ